MRSCCCCYCSYYCCCCYWFCCFAVDLKNLPLRFGQNRVYNSWDITNIEFLLGGGWVGGGPDCFSCQIQLLSWVGVVTILEHQDLILSFHLVSFRVSKSNHVIERISWGCIILAKPNNRPETSNTMTGTTSIWEIKNSRARPSMLCFSGWTPKVFNKEIIRTLKFQKVKIFRTLNISN